MKQLLLINPENVTDEEVKDYPVREAARAIVVDTNNQIALLRVSKNGYYKLPGGGIEESEDRMQALQRECLEETGSEIEVIQEVGSIVEYRKMFHLKQVSYCYLARLKGEKGKPEYTNEELERGFEQVWLPFNEALSTLKRSVTKQVEAREYIVPRDAAFLEAAKKLL